MLNLRTKLQQKPALVSKLIGRIQFAKLMKLSEDEFRLFVGEIERTPLFKRAAFPEHKESRITKLIYFSRYPQSSFFVEDKPLNELVYNKNYLNIEDIIEDKKEILEIAKRVGIDNFKDYFLYCDSDYTVEEIAQKCNITVLDAERIIDLVNIIFLSKRETPKEEAGRGLSYSRVAKIVNSGDGYNIVYFDLHYARGRYTIDYRKFARLIEEQRITKEEQNELDKLMRLLEMINTRKNTLHRIIEVIIKKQDRFFKSNNFEDRIILRQKDVAREFNINPSLVSRGIRLKSIIVPSGDDLPLKELFPSRKQIVKDLLRDIIEENNSFTDDELAKTLKSKFNIHLSRRSINDYRRDIQKSIKINSKSKILNSK